MAPLGQKDTGGDHGIVDLHGDAQPETLPSHSTTLLSLPIPNATGAPDDEPSSRLLAKLLKLPAISTAVLASETSLAAKPSARQKVNSRRGSTTFGGYTFDSDSTRPSSFPQEDDWFHQLPPKVRKAQFSLAEQALLAQQSATYIPRRSSHAHSHGNYTLTSSQQSASTLTCSSSSAAMSDTRPPSCYSRRTSHESHNSRLDDYPTSPRESTFTRGIGRIKQSPKIGHRAFSRPSLRHKQVATCETIEDTSSVDEATPRQYLRDPATQQKLKLYFGTDEKFAEILEHGFPVSSGRDVQEDAPKPTRPQPNLRRRTAIADYQKALKGNDLSFLDDPEEEEDEDVEGDDDDDRSNYATRRMNAGGHYQLNDDGCYSPVYASSISSTSTDELDNSPATPRMSAQPQPFVATMSTLPSMPSTSSMGMESKLFSPAFLFGCDRESTLRVTLTRPEYRRVGEEAQLHQQQQQRPIFYPSRLLSTSTSSTTYPICYQPEVEDEEVFKDQAEPDDTDYQIDLMRPSMDLLALEPLQILPDHAAIAALTKAARKENKDNAVRGIINRVRSSRTLEQVQSRPRVQSNPHSHAHSSWTCM